MKLRSVLVVLVLANVVLWAWHQPQVAQALGLPGPEAQREPFRLTRQVQPEAVRVLGSASSPGGTQTAATTTPPASNAAAANDSVTCLQAGPLDDAGFSQATAQLGTLGLQSDRWVDIRREIPGQWMVYMGPYRSAEQLKRKHDELQRMKIDTEDVVAPEALNPGFGLGRFSSTSDAQKHLAALQLKGAHSAKVVTVAEASVEHQIRVESLTANQVSQLQSPAAGVKPLSWHACATR